MPPRSHSLLHRLGRGHALAESLCALLLVSIGLIPLASLGATALTRLRGHEQLTHAMRAAGEFAETAELDVTPMHRFDPLPTESCPRLPDKVQAACQGGGKLAIARLASGIPGSEATLRGIALWMQP